MRLAVAFLVIGLGKMSGGAIDLTIFGVAGGAPVSGSGTNVATLAFGVVSAYEPLTAGVSRTAGATSYTISSPFGVRVVRNSGTSPSYTLQCRLGNAHSLTWRINNVTMSTNFATIATGQPYGSIISHTLSFTVPFTQTPGNISTSFELKAIAN